jgi:hypothetical protein
MAQTGTESAFSARGAAPFRTATSAGTPANAVEALAALRAGLDYLASADVTTLTVSEQADVLRGLARAESVHVAATAAVLTAFDAQAGYADDGQGSSKAWLRWQTQITSAAAAGTVGWMRRLAAHPVVAAALAAGTVSPSWARQICDWTDKLPADQRDEADRVLLGAAVKGCELADLGGLAEEIYKRCTTASPDPRDDGFADRELRLTSHFRGAAKLDGNLTPECAAAFQAVLDALATRTGPEDHRGQLQLNHDALEEMCRRLIAAGGLPDRAGQPTLIQLHMTLEQLLGMPASGEATAAWAGHGATAPAGADCDARIVPVVTGHVDQDLLDDLTGDAAPGMAARADRDLVLSRAIKLLSGPAGLAGSLRTGRLLRPAGSISLPLDLGAARETVPAYLRRAVVLRDKHCAFPGCIQRPAACQVHHIVPRSEGGPTSLTNLMLLCPFHHLVAVHRWGWTVSLHADGTTSATNRSGRTVRSHAPPNAA